MAILVVQFGQAHPSHRSRDQFRVWNYDEYRRHWLEMHRSFLGLPDIKIAAVVDPLTTRRLSEAMLAEAERLPSDLKWTLPADAVDLIYRRHAEQEPNARPFRAFPTEDGALFLDQFERDLGAINQHFPGTLRSFRGTGEDLGQDRSIGRSQRGWAKWIGLPAST